MMRVNHDYHRRGALAYFAAYDIHHGRVFSRCEDTTGIEAFTALVAQVMTTEPYASATRVFWVVNLRRIPTLVVLHLFRSRPAGTTTCPPGVMRRWGRGLGGARSGVRRRRCRPRWGYVFAPSSLWWWRWR
jgi:hypothetical protein